MSVTWSDMGWKARVSAILSALVVFAASIGLLTQSEGDETVSCIQEALAEGSSEDYHPWRNEGCQAIAERLIQTIADDFGVEWVENLLASAPVEALVPVVGPILAGEIEATEEASVEEASVEEASVEEASVEEE